MRKFEAALFDIDGTLLDTTEFIFQAYEFTLNKYGLPMKSRDAIARLIGRSLETVYELLAPDGDVPTLSRTHRGFQAEHPELSKPYPGTELTLKTLKESGLKIAAITTRSRITVIETLDHANISKYIDYVVALEDVEHLKPHPEPLLKALDYFMVHPGAAVMVGDTDVDVLAGKNTGTATIGVTYGFHGKSIAESHPDHVVDTIEEVIPLILAAREYAEEPTIIN